MDVPNRLRGRQVGLIKDHPEYFKDDEFVEASMEQNVDEMLKTILERIETLQDTLEKSEAGQLLDEQERLHNKIIAETRSRLDALGRRIGEQTKDPAVAPSLSSLPTQIRELNEKIRRPSWSTVFLLILAAAAIGGWLGSS